MYLFSNVSSSNRLIVVYVCSIRNFILDHKKSQRKSDWCSVLGDFNAPNINWELMSTVVSDSTFGSRFLTIVVNGALKQHVC